MAVVVSSFARQKSLEHLSSIKASSDCLRKAIDLSAPGEIRVCEQQTPDRGPGNGGERGGNSPVLRI